MQEKLRCQLQRLMQPLIVLKLMKQGMDGIGEITREDCIILKQFETIGGVGCADEVVDKVT
jgi:hypothetical protein